MTAGPLRRLLSSLSLSPASPVWVDRVRLWRTAVILLAFASHGFGFGVVGSSLLDLAISTRSSLPLIGYMVPARAAGIAIGALACPSLIARTRSSQLVVAVSLTAAAVLEIGIPFCPTWWSV